MNTKHIFSMLIKISLILYLVRIQRHYMNWLVNGTFETQYAIINRNPCKGVEHTGIYLLAWVVLYTFYKDHNQKLKVMFNEFLNFDVERPLEELLQSIKTSLKNIDYSKSPSKCTKLPNFDKMLTTSLEKSIYLKV
ncbi:hypothetical protein Avbf_12991 [Armadillidium vulgare]|nr:hypothetical protein Avbf_12991 [Armadillidium vulgare]